MFMAAGKEDLCLGTKEMKILHGLSIKCLHSLSTLALACEIGEVATLG